MTLFGTAGFGGQPKSMTKAGNIFNNNDLYLLYFEIPNKGCIRIAIWKPFFWSHQQYRLNTKWIFIVFVLVIVVVLHRGSTTVLSFENVFVKQVEGGVIIWDRNWVITPTSSPFFNRIMTKLKKCKDFTKNEQSISKIILLQLIYS